MSLLGGLMGAGQGMGALAGTQALQAAQAQVAQQAAVNIYNTTSTANHIYFAQTATVSTAATTTTITNAMANALYSSQHLANSTNSPLVMAVQRLMGNCSIADGEECRLTLPDGAILEVNADGSYILNDADSKIVYRANRSRDFNPFINASDKLESFIRFCGDAGVQQGDVLSIPIKHFIAWLIVEAARADNEPEPDIPQLPNLRNAPKPRHNMCGRTISKRRRRRLTVRTKARNSQRQSA